MEKTSKWLMLFTRASGFLLIGINLFRLFDNIEYLNFMQAPGPALINSIIILLISYLPRIFIASKFEISHKLYSLLLVSIALSLTGGLIFELYLHLPGWDSLMHFMNGGLMTLIGISVANMILGKEKAQSLNPLFIVLFAFSFSMMLGTIWEIFEFFSDGMFNSNMQRFKDIDTGIEFIGRNAIADTMKDLILNTIGAIIVSVITYFDIKKGAPYIEELLINKSLTSSDMYQSTEE